MILQIPHKLYALFLQGLKESLVLFYQCHYTVLGVHRQASKEDIEVAYFEKIKVQTHLNGNLKEETKVILRAYETLSDDDTRRVYDKQLSEVADLVKSASVGEVVFRNQNSDSPLGRQPAEGSEAWLPAGK